MLDKKTYKILKFISKKSPITQEEIDKHFKSKCDLNVRQLVDLKFIEEKEGLYMKPKFLLLGYEYTILPPGQAYIEENSKGFLKNFVTLTAFFAGICTIIGFIITLTK